MILNITCNGGWNLTLDTETGEVCGIPEGTLNVDAGYLHLPNGATFSDEEKTEIARITILSFAGRWHPWSSIPLRCTVYGRRPWKPGEKLGLLREIMAARVDAHPMTFLDGNGPSVESEEERARQVATLQDQDHHQCLVEGKSDHLSIGGSFQAFCKDGWLEEAERIKGSTIWLA